MIILKNISKRIDNHQILDDIFLSLPSKGFVVLKGENGSGKTSLLNIISLLDDKFQGTLQIDDEDIKTWNDNTKAKYRYHNISYCFQKNNLISFLNIDENKNLDLIFSKNKFSKETNKKISNLSQGEQQLTALKHILKPGKKIYLLDEITSSLDINNKNKVLNLIKDMAKNALVIIVSHDKELSSFADMVLLLDHGHLSVLKEQANNDNIETIEAEKNNKSLKLSSRLFGKYFLTNLKLNLSSSLLNFAICFLIFACLSIFSFIPRFSLDSNIDTLPEIFTSIKEGPLDEDLLNKFPNDTSIALNGSFSGGDSSFSLPIILTDEVEGNYVYVNQETYSMLENYGKNEDHLSFATRDFIYRNLELRIDDSVSFLAGYVNINELKPTSKIESIRIFDGYWDNDFFSARHYILLERDSEYFNPGTPIYCNETYAINNLDMTFSNPLEDDTLYTYYDELITDKITHFDKKLQYNSKVKDKGLDLNEVFPEGVKTEYIPPTAKTNQKNTFYVVVSNETFDKIKYSLPSYDTIVISLKNNRDEILNFLSSNNIKFNVRQWLCSLNEYEKIENTISQYNYAIDSNEDMFVSLWGKIGFYGLTPILLFFISFIAYFNYHQNKQNKLILKKEGYNNIRLFLLFSLPNIFFTILSILLGYFAGYSYIISTDSLTFTPSFNIIHLIVILVFIIFTCLINILSFRRNKYE